MKCWTKVSYVLAACISSPFPLLRVCTSEHWKLQLHQPFPGKPILLIHLLYAAADLCFLCAVCSSQKSLATSACCILLTQRSFGTTVFSTSLPGKRPADSWQWKPTSSFSSTRAPRLGRMSLLWSSLTPSASQYHTFSFTIHCLCVGACSVISRRLFVTPEL